MNSKVPPNSPSKEVDPSASQPAPPKTALPDWYVDSNMSQPIRPSKPLIGRATYSGWYPSSPSQSISPSGDRSAWCPELNNPRGSNNIITIASSSGRNTFEKYNDEALMATQLPNPRESDKNENMISSVVAQDGSTKGEDKADANESPAIRRNRFYCERRPQADPSDSTEVPASTPSTSSAGNAGDDWQTTAPREYNRKVARCTVRRPTPAAKLSSQLSEPLETQPCNARSEVCEPTFKEDNSQDMSTKPLTPAQLNSWEPMVQRSKNSCPAKFNSTTAAQPASLSVDTPSSSTLSPLLSTETRAYQAYLKHHTAAQRLIGFDSSQQTSPLSLSEFTTRRAANGVMTHESESFTDATNDTAMNLEATGNEASGGSFMSLDRLVRETKSKSKQASTDWESFRSLASKTLTRRPEDTKTTDQQSRPAYGSSEWAQSLEEIDRLEQQTEALTNRIEDVLQTEIQKLKSSMQKDSQDIYGERVNQVESAKAKILEKFRQPEKRRSSGYTVAAWDGPRSLTEVVKNKDQAEPTKLSVISSETERQQLAASKDRSAKSAHANRKETIFEMSQQQAEKNRLERLEYQRMYQPKLAEAGAGVSEIERLKDLGMEIKMYANNPDVYRVKMRNIQVKSRVCVGDRMETEESQAKQPQREDVNQALGQKRLRPVKTLDSDDTDDMQSSSEARGFKKYQKRGADDSPKTANKGAERNENRERQSQNHACMPMIFLPNIRPPASSAELDRDLYIHAKLAESCRKDQEAQFGTSFYSAAAAPNVDTTKLSLDEKIERLVQLRCQQHVYRPELHREEVQRLRRDMRDKYIGMEAPKKMAGPSEYQKLQVLAKKLLQKYLQRPELFQKENGIAASSTTHSENDIKIDGITDEQVQKMDFMIKKSMKRIFPRPELYQKGYRAASSDTRANMDGASELDDEKIESLAKRLAVNYSLGQKRGRFILPTSSNPRREQVLRDLNRKRNQQIMNAVRSNIQRKRNEMLDVIRSNQRAMARAGIPAYSDDYTDTDWSDYEDMDDVDLTVGSTWGDVCDHAGSYVHSADEIAEADKWAESVGLTVVDGDTKSDIAVSGSVNGDVEDKVLRWKDTYDNSIGEFWYGLADDEDEDLTVSDIEDVEMEEGGDWDMLSSDSSFDLIDER